MQLVPGTLEPDVNAGIRLLHEDEAIIVLHKPAPLPMHPGGRFNRNTLASFVKGFRDEESGEIALPQELQEAIRVTEWHRLNMRKS